MMGRVPGKGGTSCRQMVRACNEDHVAAGARRGTIWRSLGLLHVITDMPTCARACTCPQPMTTRRGHGGKREALVPSLPHLERSPPSPEGEQSPGHSPGPRTWKEAEGQTDRQMSPWILNGAGDGKWPAPAIPAQAPSLALS